MTADTAFALGKALAASLGGDKPLIYIGTDTRQSADMVAEAFIGGALSMGADCMLGGIMPTPAVAFNIKKRRAAAGVVVSASHNPPQHNGLKVFGADAYKLSDAEEARIEEIMQRSSFDYPSGCGKLYHDKNGWKAHADYLIKAVDTTLEGMRLVVDGAHGAACSTARYVFNRVGADCIFVACRPIGRLINSGCGAIHPGKAIHIAKEERCLAAFCFDGDADRIMAGDKCGNLVNGDFIMYILAREMQEAAKLNGAGVVATVMTNNGVERAYERLGIQMHRAPVGDKYVIQDMLKRGANLGGEQSGHIILTDYGTTGDGVLSALLTAKALKDASFAERLSDIKLIPQMLINVSASASILTDEKFLAACAERERVLCETGGRLLVRMSGTEQKLRIMAECGDSGLCSKVCADLAELAMLNA